MSGVRTVGSLLPADVLAAALDGALPGMAARDYHLAAGETPRQAASRSWTYLQGAYRAFRDELATLPGSQRGTQLTREKWLQVLLRELDFGRVPTTPGGHLSVDGAQYPISHLWADVPVHLLGWEVDLDARSQGVAGAARAPQSMVQELLNRSDEHLWGVLSNGRRLRLLRDSSAMVGQSYVEFDLESIFDGESFSDFVLLWLVCHESRLERLPGNPDDAGEPTEGLPTDRWLERWRGHAIETGTRALAQLSTQVTQALEVLGTGFLQHPENEALRARLVVGQVTSADFQRSLLRTVYRLLFWFVAEDRAVLLDPAAPPEAVARYDAYFASARLRRIARRRVGTRHADRWAAVRLVLEGLGREGGRPELGVPGLGGLFEPGPLDVTDDAALPNTALLGAVRLLSTTREKGGARVRAVDFRNLGAEELGGIYEALLELHPRLDPVERTFTLIEAAGNERKKSGSYYTPSSLIELLLDTALQPLVDEAMKASDPQAALLALTVCDPACGSGHFLVAAARRIAIALATVRHGETKPTPTQVQAALREVVGRCIHGVDINPMAAELAKVSLWLEALEPGKPLAFLDASIRVGNALIGTTPALLAQGIPDEAYTALTGDDRKVVTALRRRNKSEREQLATGHEQLDLLEPTGLPVENARLAWHANALRAMPTGSLSEVHFAQARMRTLEDDPRRRHAQLLADAWCAAFMQPKTTDTAGEVVTTRVLHRIAEADAQRLAAEESTSPGPDAAAPIVTAAMRAAIAEQANRYRFFHWHLEFSHIFPVPESLAEAGPQGWEGGFACIVGNPPWERVKLQEQEFFAERDPEIAGAKNAAARKKLIAALPQSDPLLWADWTTASRQAEAESSFLRLSGRYPLCGRGDVNTYAVFAEAFRDFIAPSGRSGVITPTGLATDATTSAFFADTLSTGRLAAFFDFENEAKIFAGVDHRVRFATSTFAGLAGGIDSVNFAFVVRHVEDVPRRTFRMAPAEVLLLNPNTGTLPMFRSRIDADLTLGIYQRHPVLIRDDDPDGNPWDLTFMTMFHMANDSSLFRTADDLEVLGADFDGWAWVASNPDGSTKRWLPLYEAKLLSHWDDRFSTYRDATQAQLNVGSLPRLTEAQHDNPGCEPLARYWIEDAAVVKAAGERAERGWLFGWRDIARSSDMRTMVPSVLPMTAVGHVFPLAISIPGSAQLLQCAWSSLTFDFTVRQSLSGTHLTYGVLKQIACPTPDTFAATPPWLDESLADWVRPRVLELTYTSYRIAPYAEDLGDLDAEGLVHEPFRWLPERRFAIRAELDAAMLHVYGLTRLEAEHVLDSFPVLRKYEEAPPGKGGYGEFRTKRMVLDLYEQMAEAAATGAPWRSPLDPPPGSGPRHPTLEPHR